MKSMPKAFFVGVSMALLLGAWQIALAGTTGKIRGLVVNKATGGTAFRRQCHH